jgi:hypothetical protein
MFECYLSMACIGFLQIIGRIFMHIRHVVWHSEPFQATLSIMLSIDNPLSKSMQFSLSFVMNHVTSFEPTMLYLFISLELDRVLSTWH